MEMVFEQSPASLLFDVIPQRGDRELNMGYWVSGDRVELSFPAEQMSLLKTFLAPPEF